MISSEDYYDSLLEAELEANEHDALLQEIEALLKELAEKQDEIDALTWELREAEQHIHHLEGK